MMKRVCFVIPSLDVGGTERQLLYLIKGIAEHFEVLVICTRAEGAWAGDVRRIGRVKVLGLRSGWDPRLKSRLRKLFQRYKPDIVHSYMFGFDYPVNVAARAENVPVVISSRRQIATWKRTRHVRHQRKGNALVDAIVANSHEVAEFASKQEGESIERYTVIFNGIDIERFNSSTNLSEIRKRYRVPIGPKIIGIVANFSPVKDHTLFIQMAQRLLERRSDLHFVMVGTGPLVDETTASIELSGLKEFFTRISTISELPDVYRMLAVCVLTSKAEGFPNVIMESLASGTPVVAANVGGIPELIEHGVTGMLVNTREPDDFADSVEEYLNHPERAERAAQRGRVFVSETLSLQGMIDAHLDLYNDLLRDKGVD